MAIMKTPGVYIVEKNAFPNSVVDVPTAVPAFVGYTEKSMQGNESLLNKPFRISSMAEFHSYFGGAPTPVFKVAKKAADTPSDVVISNTDYMLVAPAKQYTFYYNLLLFFANGGGPCYIVSVGSYKDNVSADAFLAGIEALKREQEPTMLVIPEAVNLPIDKCTLVQQTMLMHCGYEMRNRVAILDLKNEKEPVKTFREGIGNNQLGFGAAYYPWLKTSIIGDSYISVRNLEYDDMLKEVLKIEIQDWDDEEVSALVDRMGSAKAAAPVKAPAKEGEEKEKATPAAKPADNKKITEEEKYYLHLILLQNSAIYKNIFAIINKQLNFLPPSAAMAGLYTMTDNTRGVWKAPANISINGVVAPAVNISNAEQEDLNVPLSGKAVNAIRTFTGEGLKVWGARTLDGNSLDWRYINVRRTMIYLEESVKNAARAYVFDPNTANTWVNIKSMIGNFLNSVWKRGGLAGATPEDAYSVHVGLGETMTSEDILEGILRVTVLVAISRPAEFIEITFQQQMQKS
ncbi:phage tail sheath protein FI [Parabacteroides sp. PFB2-10]|uniref:phage tail sheath family protein n=1 Tax=Parabacteroides sp. PFB2-10 TaxID=1742405 RepID=UPI002475A1CE|nr:phage tail sheath C-terminal domain-containing protein [Parabacteroides sp. PFB2-10]MDH6313654.1 phage tail sheath protein FI [Parabacteroides sp. PFB2-10]